MRCEISISKGPLKISRIEKRFTFAKKNEFHIKDHLKQNISKFQTNV